MVKEIPLQNGMVAIVDDEDYERCMEQMWSIAVVNETTISVTSSSLKIMLSHFILDLDKTCEKVVGFKNNNRLDFQKMNLVLMERTLQGIGAKGNRNTSSKYKGVGWYERKQRWAARIDINKKRIFLGYFTEEDEAAKAYNDAVMKFRQGEGYMNVIGENNNADTFLLEKSLIHRRKNGTTSDFRGVSWDENNNKWKVKITVEGKGIHVGRFESEQEAAKAYDKKAFELHGDKAILNFPIEKEMEK